jgi:acetyl esterase/lipase
MALDRHAKRFLDMLSAGAPADVSRMTIGEVREAFAKLMRLSETGIGGESVETRLCSAPGEAIGARVYSPNAAGKGRLPGLVYFHGGGLVAGSLETHDALARLLANETGCRLVSVDYRLAPEDKFPAAVTDCHAATLAVFGQAEALGIDPARIGIAGDSAGATLAAVVCQMLCQTQSAKPALQLLLCPIMDFVTEMPSRLAFGHGYLLDRAMLARDLGYYLPAGAEAADWRVSPLRLRDLSRLPPSYIHTAEFDPLRDEGDTYANVLRRAGVTVSYTCHPGMIHLFYALGSVIPYARTAIKKIGSEIRAAFG